jgi:uncharacterized protein YgiM (DUF1202 family)
MNRVFIAFLVSLFSFSGLMSETVVTSNTVNIHSGASASADVLASVPAGTSLQTLDSVDGYGWVEVEYNGETGYVASYLLPKHRKISHTIATRHVSTVSCSSGSYSYSILNQYGIVEHIIQHTVLIILMVFIGIRMAI